MIEVIDGNPLTMFASQDITSVDRPEGFALLDDLFLDLRHLLMESSRYHQKHGLV